jgi:hypothetical protein
MKTKELITEANALPVEERALVVDSLLKSMNPPQSGIEKKWIRLAKTRLEEIKSGQVNTVSDKDLFSRILNRF